MTDAMDEVGERYFGQGQSSIYLRVEKHTIEMLHFTFDNVGVGEPLTKQQRAWIDKLFQEATRIDASS